MGGYQWHGGRLERGEYQCCLAGHGSVRVEGGEKRWLQKDVAMRSCKLAHCIKLIYL